MPIELAIILGIVQGLTEFLPVSSSGHLVVFQHYLEPIFGASKTPLAFDVLVHLATLVVTLCYLFPDIRAVLSHAHRRTPEGETVRQLILRTIVGTVPAVLVVLLLKDQIEAAFDSLSAAGIGFLITACVLESAHRKQIKFRPPQSDKDSVLSWKLPSLPQAFIIGCAQSVAILPGVSRSGSTIATALLLGLPAESAMRFSFFLFIPAVLGASVLELGDLSALPESDMSAYLLGFVITIVVGFFAMRLLTRLVSSAKLRYFAIYTALLGLAINLL